MNTREKQLSAFVTEWNGTGALVMSRLYIGMQQALHSGTVPNGMFGNVIREAGLGIPETNLDPETKEFWEGCCQDIDDNSFRIIVNGVLLYEGVKIFTASISPEHALGDERLLKGFERIDT